MPNLTQPLPHKGPIYRLAEDLDHVQALVEGGTIRLSLASSYLAEEDVGFLTPDEVLQSDWTGGDPNVFSGGGLEIGGIDIDFKDNYLNGTRLPDTRGSRFRQDAYILCFSRNFNDRVLERQQNKRCYVQVHDVARLKEALDSAMGSTSLAGGVAYTNGDNRGHFLKGLASASQDEYRFVWPLRQNERVDLHHWIKLPPGLADQLTMINH